MKKPFDVLAEGLLSEKSRDDKTPLELFLVGIRTLASQLSITKKALVAILDAACSEVPALK